MLFALILWFSSGSGAEAGVSSIHQEFQNQTLCHAALIQANMEINKSTESGAPYAGGMCVQIREGQSQNDSY